MMKFSAKIIEYVNPDTELEIKLALEFFKYCTQLDLPKVYSDALERAIFMGQKFFKEKGTSGIPIHAEREHLLILYYDIEHMENKLIANIYASILFSLRSFYNFLAGNTGAIIWIIADNFSDVILSDENLVKFILNLFPMIIDSKLSCAERDEYDQFGYGMDDKDEMFQKLLELLPVEQHKMVLFNLDLFR